MNLYLALVGLILLNIGLIQINYILPFLVTGTLILVAVAFASAVDLYLHLNKAGKK